MFSLGLVAVMAVALTAQAQSDAQDYTGEPGYVDFTQFQGLKGGSEVVEVFLTQPLLSVARWAVVDDDPELAEMLGNLKLLRVNVYSFKPDKRAALGKNVDTFATALGKQGWNRIVKVKDEDGTWNILEKMDEKGGSEGAPMLNGVVLVGMGGEDSDIRYQDGDDIEAIFVNVVGQLDFAQLNKLGEHFDIPQLEGLQEQAGDAGKSQGNDEGNDEEE